MNSPYPPILAAPPDLVESFDTICSAPKALESIEELAREENWEELPLMRSAAWQDFSTSVRKAFAVRDHLILKGFPVSADGASLLLAARLIGCKFRLYRGGQVVKFFKVSPWTTELSHTTRSGEFHTDLNTESITPAITAMQCSDPDPDMPRYGINRVARLIDLLSCLKKHGGFETLRFLTKQTVTMLNDRSSSSWSGHIVEGDLIRYHPETLRAAERRLGRFEPLLEDHIANLARAAVAVSQPFALDRGDILLLSNHRTLHYRGECSVVFKQYPMEFLSRSVFVLHATRELKD